MRRAFSLTELLVTLAIIALISAFTIPRFLNIQAAARVQTVRDQAKALQQAVLAWQGSFSTLSALDTAFGNVSDLPSANLTTVDDYLDAGFLSSANLTANVAATIPYYATDIMRSIRGTAPSNITVNIGGTDYVVAPATAITHAHMRVYWPTANRRTTQPVVLLFLPN